MNFVNFYITLPPAAYIKIEHEAQKMNLTRNEIILNIIMGWITGQSADLEGKKNARFENLYN